MDRRWIRAILDRRGKRFNTIDKIFEFSNRWIVALIIKNQIIFSSNESLLAASRYGRRIRTSITPNTEDADRVHVQGLYIFLLFLRSTLQKNVEGCSSSKKSVLFFLIFFLFWGGGEGRGGGDEDNNVRLDFNNTCGSSSPQRHIAGGV